MFYSIVRGYPAPNKFNGTSDVSFREFITHVTDRLIKGKGVNEHMDTYEHLCQPCAINYIFLGTHDLFQNKCMHQSTSLYINFVYVAVLNMREGNVFVLPLCLCACLSVLIRARHLMFGVVEDIDHI